MRLVTWNINSVRLRLDALRRLADTLQPDVVCLQETKTPDDKFPEEEIRNMGFGDVRRRGMKSYNGVAILARDALGASATRDWCDQRDCRHVSVDMTLPGGEAAELHNFYVPAGGDEPDPETNGKFAHKLRFLDEMTAHFEAMENSRPRILVGDLNIAPLETDVWSHRQLLKVVSHTPVEVERLGRAQASLPWVDVVRKIVPPGEKLYSWWSYRARDWSAADKGRRLDHIWVSRDLADWVADAGVLREARGWKQPSDHAPVWADFRAPT